MFTQLIKLFEDAINAMIPKQTALELYLADAQNPADVKEKLRQWESGHASDSLRF